MGKLFIYKSTKVKALSFAFFLFFSLFPPSSALAEEVSSWEEVSQALNAGQAVVLLPLQSEIPLDLQDQPPPSQPELHFSGAQLEGGTSSVARATLAFPPISVGGKVDISPFVFLNGEQSGEGETLSIGGGLVISIGDGVQVQLSIEEMVHPSPQREYNIGVVFRF